MARIDYSVRTIPITVRITGVREFNAWLSFASGLLRIVARVMRLSIKIEVIYG
jgi:hypothetical protein